MFLLPDQSPYRLLLDAVYELQDGEGRLIWEMFEELPSRQDYPEYYKVIKDPLDLQTVESKIRVSGKMQQYLCFCILFQIYNFHYF